MTWFDDENEGEFVSELFESNVEEVVVQPNKPKMD